MDVRINITELLRRYHIEIDGCYVGNLGRKYNEDEITAFIRKIYEKGFEDGYEKHDMDCDDAYDKGFADGFDDWFEGNKIHGYGK